MKRYVYAMSKSRKDIGDDLEQGCDMLILHLIKLRMYPDVEDCHHWRKEVAEKLHRVDSFKGSHKLPSAEFILHNTIDVHLPRLSKYIHVAEVDYDCSTSTFDPNILKNDIIDYFTWLANELANDGVVAYTDIIHYLENHGF